MTTTTKPPLNLEPIRTALAAALRGPWLWNLNLKSKRLSLEAQVSGLETVMDFTRWGMGGARARFQDREGFMCEAERYAKIVPQRHHHADWYQTLDHPDANLIARARVWLEELVGEVDDLRARVAELASAEAKRQHEIEIYLKGGPTKLELAQLRIERLEQNFGEALDLLEREGDCKHNVWRAALEDRPWPPACGSCGDKKLYMSTVRGDEPSACVQCAKKPCSTCAMPGVPHQPNCPFKPKEAA